MVHPHGSFVGQCCQGQAQEITVEVILCKYSQRVWQARPNFQHCVNTSIGVFTESSETTTILSSYAYLHAPDFVTPKGVQPPALCHASATRESP